MKKWRFGYWLKLVIAIRLITDATEIIAAYGVYRRKIRREAIARLRRNRRRALKRRLRESRQQDRHYTSR